MYKTYNLNIAEWYFRAGFAVFKLHPDDSEEQCYSYYDVIDADGSLFLIDAQIGQEIAQ